MSWDNFFTAFSGASAALIGVTFAFIVSKLLSNISDSDSLNNETTDMVIERKVILNEISNIAFCWHDKMIIKYGYQIKQKYKQGQITNMQNIIEKIEEETKRRIYLVDESLEYIKAEMSEIDEENRKRQIPTKATVDGKETTIMITPPDLLGNMPEIPFDQNMWKEVNEEEVKFANCYQKSEIQIDKFKNLITKINIKINDFRVIKNIITAFIPITTMTVIYPLHFIPTQTNEMPKISFSITNFIQLWSSLKGIMLTMLFVSTVGSMVYFIVLCKKNINGLDKIRKAILTDYLDIKKYCELF